MITTLDTIDSNVSHLMLRGMEGVFVSMPVLHKNTDGILCLACFAWEANRKQRNVPKPKYVVVTPLNNNGAISITEAPECGLPSVCTAKPISYWTQRSLARDLDEVISEYLSTGELNEYKYYYYLENMLPNYSEEYYPLFKELNVPEATIDLLRK